MVYKSYNELKGHILDVDDIIIFKINNKSLIYDVQVNYLHCKSDYNSVIFDLLNINKYKFCSYYYKYSTNNRGDFPYSRLEDYEALTNVALGLFEMCESFYKVNIWD